MPEVFSFLIEDASTSSPTVTELAVYLHFEGADVSPGNRALYELLLSIAESTVEARQAHRGPWIALRLGICACAN